MRMYCRIVDLPTSLTQAGITTIAFDLDLNATFHEDGPGDGSLGPVVEAVPVTVSPGSPAVVFDRVSTSSAEPKKRGRKKAGESAPAAAETPQALTTPIPLPTRQSDFTPSPTLSGNVRTFPAIPSMSPVTSADGGVQVAGHHPGVPVGTSIVTPTLGGFSAQPAFGQGVAPWASSAAVPVAPPMTLQQIHGVMLKAHQINPDGFAQAMGAAGLQPNAVTVADGARVMAALAPVVGVN